MELSLSDDEYSVNIILSTSEPLTTIYGANLCFCLSFSRDQINRDTPEESKKYVAGSYYIPGLKNHILKKIQHLIDTMELTIFPNQQEK